MRKITLALLAILIFWGLDLHAQNHAEVSRPKKVEKYKAVRYLDSVKVNYSTSQVVTAFDGDSYKFLQELFKNFWIHPKSVTESRYGVLVKSIHYKKTNRDFIFVIAINKYYFYAIERLDKSFAVEVYYRRAFKKEGSSSRDDAAIFGTNLDLDNWEQSLKALIY